MKPISFHNNYAIKTIETDNLSFEGVGIGCREIVDEFITDLNNEAESGMNLGSHPEHIDIPDQRSTLRVHKLYPSGDGDNSSSLPSKMHQTSLDITFNRMNDRLSIEMKISAFSVLRYLTYAVQVTGFVILFLLCFNLYLNFGGFNGMVLNYVQNNLQHPTNDPQGVAEHLIKYEGFKFYHFFIKFSDDFPPSIAAVISTAWMAIMGLSGICGFLIHKMPHRFYSVVFKLIDQPTINEFESFVGSHAAWVKQILGNTLYRLRIDQSGVTYR